MTAPSTRYGPWAAACSGEARRLQYILFRSRHTDDTFALCTTSARSTVKRPSARLCDVTISLALGKTFRNINSLEIFRSSSGGHLLCISHQKNPLARRSDWRYYCPRSADTYGGVWTE